MASTPLRAHLAGLRRAYAAALAGANTSRLSVLPAGLSEHAERVSVLRERLVAAAAKAAIGQAIIDAFPFPAVMLNEQLATRLSNRAWNADGGSQAVIQGAARAVRAGEHQELADAIRSRRRRFLPVSATGLKRPALVIPLARDFLATEATALVVIGSAQRATSAVFASSAQSLFGLTPAESAVAGAALAGKSLAQLAASRGTSLQTVRYQMKSVLLKTGASTRARFNGLLLHSLWQPNAPD